MNRGGLWVSIAVAAVALATGVSSGPAAASDLGELQARGLLRVVVSSDEAEETFSLRPGTEPGFERELIESFARLHGLKVEPVPAKTLADRIPALLEGKGDVIVAIFDTPERRERVDFTAEVMPTYNVAVTHKPHAALHDATQLPKERVGATVGGQPAEAALAAGVPAAALQTFERTDVMLEALQKGRLTVVVLPVSELALASKRFPGLEAGATVGPVGTVAWAVRKQDDQLKRALNEYLANARKSGSWNRLIVKYFGDQVLKVLGRAR
jgi:ABC-type amino acid transport substrate-binding protein